jgi:hypothetical protein
MVAMIFFGHLMYHLSLQKVKAILMPCCAMQAWRKGQTKNSDGNGVVRPTTLACKN